jgi:hypothetical protein
MSGVENPRMAAAHQPSELACQQSARFLFISSCPEVSVFHGIAAFQCFNLPPCESSIFTRLHSSPSSGKNTVLNVAAPTTPTAPVSCLVSGSVFFQ